jgi:long-chain acyl-CoA synthetase
MKYRNVYSLFREQTARYGAADVFYTRAGGEWRARSWTEFEENVHDFACALLARGLTRGAAVAILAGNVPEWTIADIAAIAAGGVGVGIYPTSSPEQCEYIINHSDAEFVFVDSASQLEKILPLDCPRVKEIVHLGGGKSAIGTRSDRRVAAFDDFLAFGRAGRAEFLPRVEETGFGLTPEDVAIMVYTSGTTGPPKGAMLSHRYILNSVESLRRSVPIFETDATLSYLPGCHVAERISGIYNRLYNGAAAHFVDDLAKLYAYMLEVRPTVFASLPRFFEKIYAKVVSEHGAEASEQALKDAFGGRIRLLTSGGAPLPNEIADFFARRKLPILQAYGLTENICVAFNTVDHLKFGTVGRPMPMCEVETAADGEILVKSPMMFSGYYKDPEKTAEMFDAEGRLKTGDLGALDADGFLTITGRKKEIIVLSTGKNVAPAPVENLVKENHLVSQCFLSGDGRSYCVALVTLNQAEAEAYARARGIEHEDFAALTRDRRIEASIRQTIERANERLSSSERIKKFVILERDFSLAEDEITPTLKLKRAVVAGKFKDRIDRLYET